MKRLALIALAALMLPGSMVFAQDRDHDRRRADRPQRDRRENDRQEHDRRDNDRRQQAQNAEQEAARRLHAKVMQYLQRLDANNNRQLEADEWNGDGQLFRRLDQNDDGVISGREIHPLINHLKQRLRNHAADGDEEEGEGDAQNAEEGDGEGETDRRRDRDRRREADRQRHRDGDQRRRHRDRRIARRR